MATKQVAMAIGGALFSALIGQANASVGVYYIDAYVDSMWSDVTGATTTDHVGAQYADGFGSTVTPAYLSGSFAFNHSSSSAATPQSVVGTGGYANSDSRLNTTISGFGFSLTGGGTSGVLRGADASATSISADLVSYLSVNFSLPIENSPHYLTLTGTATADAHSTLFLRISEFSNGGNTVSDLVYINRTGANGTNFTDSWTNEQFLLTPGNDYSLDFYAQPVFTASAAEPGAFGGTSQIDLSATFAPVPEPGVFAVLLGGSVVMLRRRRDKKAKSV